MFPDNGRAEISIDFGRISNVKALKKILSQQIDQFLCLHPQHMKSESRSDQGKRDWDEILQAGDLKTQGLRNLEIAKRLFPKEFVHGRAVKKENREAARRNSESKAAQYVAEYNRMVEGGFLNMTFP